MLITYDLCTGQGSTYCHTNHYIFNVKIFEKNIYIYIYVCVYYMCIIYIYINNNNFVKSKYRNKKTQKI